MSQHIVFYEVKMKHASGTSLFTMRQRLHAQASFKLIFMTKSIIFLTLCRQKCNFQKKNITFTCITSTWYAQTRGKMNVFFEKTSFCLVKSMLFHAPDPPRHVNLVWRGNGKRKWTNSCFIPATCSFAVPSTH